jgi:hypothetical protein
MGVKAALARAIGLAIGIALLLVAGCSSAGSPDRARSASELLKLALAYAPMVALHPRERWRPLSAEAFLDRSTLRWRGGDCGGAALAVGHGAHERAALPLLDPARLGAASPLPYRHVVRHPPACRPGTSFSTADYSRPYDPLRHNDFAPSEGFYLDLDDGARTGARLVRRGSSARVGDVPVYFGHESVRVHRGAGTRIVYWMLFGMSRRGGPRRWAVPHAHEGDWRRIGVLLRATGAGGFRPASVRYYGDDGGRIDIPWEAADRRGLHPWAFVARGSHDLFPAPIRSPVSVRDDAGNRKTLYDVTGDCPRCVEWRTWRALRAARSRPWWGYGGAWGDSPGLSQVPAGLGPSKWTDVRPFELE